MKSRLPVALGAFVIWVVITVWFPKLIWPGQASLNEIISRGFGWAWMLAGAFILGVVLWQGWRDVGLNRGASLRSWGLAWLPLIYIVGALGGAAYLGLPAPMVLFLVLVNCMFVGFSEELMFRGALLQALRHSLPVWPAVIITSIAFGAIHSLNVFVTGDLVPALVQSCAACLSGFFFIALRLRSGSLWPPVMIHGLWDFSTFMLVLAGSTPQQGVLAPEAAAGPSGSGLAVLFPLLLVLPNAIYGLWLMRNIGRTHTSPTD